MTIIIETPAPPTRERLVLVPEGVPPRDGRPAYRDATPADLERAGWVTGEMLAEHVRIVWAAGQKAEPVGVAMLRKLKERAEKAERERDEALLRAHTGVVHYEIPAKDRATDEELGRVFGEAYTVEESPDHGVALRTAYLAVAAHVRKERPSEPRRPATDDELVDLYREVYETHGGGTISVSHDDCRRAAVLALAAHVRKERCLVAEAVGMGTGITISRTSERVPGTTGMWDVYATRRPDVPGEHYAYGVPASDVPATLARMLGEVGRG